MKYTYLLIDLFTILIPFIFSFHPRLRFYKTWAAFFPAVIMTGITFIAADMGFTAMGVWGFNEQYLTGIRIFNLPLEEVLFFLCIPYACVFTFHCLGILFKMDPSQKIINGITVGLLGFLLVLGLWNLGKIYTSSTFLSLALLLTITRYVLKTHWLGKFYIVYGILLLPFLVVNGLLTGTGLEAPVVWYNETEFMGIRVLTIPVEDIFYGMELILMNLLIYHYLLDRNKKIPT